jgi:hypothetical protein
MNWQWDDETGEPTRLVGFDYSEPTAHNQVRAVLRARRASAARGTAWPRMPRVGAPRACALHHR